MKNNILMRIMKPVLFMTLVFAIFAVNKNYVKAEDGYVMDYATNQRVTEMVPFVVTTGSEADISKRSLYSIYIPSTTKAIIVPIKINSKGVLQYVYGDENKLSDNIVVELYSDLACTTKIKYSNYSGAAEFPSAGTYYIKFSIPSYITPVGDHTLILFDCNFLDGKNATLKNKKWKTSVLSGYNKPIYYKVKVTKPGYIEFNVEGDYSTYVTLCSSKKKSLSEECYIYSKNSSSATATKAVFGVKKGTYLIKATSSSNIIRVKSVFKPVKDASGSSKAKAATLKIGTAKKGLVLPSEKTNKNDWFKFTITKASKIEMKILGNVSSGEIKYELTGTGISNSLTGTVNKVGHNEKYGLYLIGKKTLPKGTYYIRFFKDSKKTSGNYTVKVSKK